MWTTSNADHSLWALRRTVRPTATVLDVNEFKRHRKITTTDEDTYLSQLLPAVEDIVERELNRALCQQTLALTFDFGFPAEQTIQLPRAPLISVDSVQYVDSAGAPQTLSASKYHVRAGDPGVLCLNDGESWPTTDKVLAAVTITYKAGYGTKPSDVPPTIRPLMWLLAAHYHENREIVVTGTIVSPIPQTYERLLWGLRDTRF